MYMWLTLWPPDCTKNNSVLLASRGDFRVSKVIQFSNNASARREWFVFNKILSAQHSTGRTADF